MTAPRKDGRKQLGALGEELAAQFLHQAGYVIAARNWRCRTGELDIVAESGGVLVFVEVRTRRPTGSFGSAKESVDLRKQLKVRETAQFYLHRYKIYDRSVRFDVVSVELSEAGDSPRIEHIQGAF